MALIYLFAGSTLYGIFVLGVLWGLIAFHYQTHQILALFHAALLGVLFVLTLRHQGFPANLGDLIERIKPPSSPLHIG